MENRLGTWAMTVAPERLMAPARSFMRSDSLGMQMQPPLRSVKKTSITDTSKVKAENWKMRARSLKPKMSLQAEAETVRAVCSTMLALGVPVVPDVNTAYAASVGTVSASSNAGALSLNLPSSTSMASSEMREAMSRRDEEQSTTGACNWFTKERRRSSA